ncbi:hypothetical protein RI367_006741 [Sorochytrium milnesiophthora]
MSFCNSALGGWGPVSDLAPVDLTPCFDQAVLQALPSVLLCTAGLARVKYLWPRPTKFALSGAGFWTKVALSAIALALSVGVLVTSLSANDNSLVFSTVLSTIATLIACLVLVLERRKQGIESTILTSFWLLRLAAGAWSLRTYKNYAIDASMPTFYLLFAILTAVCGACMLAETLLVPKRDPKDLPEPAVSLFSRASFMWMTPMLLKGWKKTLVHDDLYNIGTKFESVALTEDYHRLEAKTSKQSQRLFWGLIRRHRFPLIISMLAEAAGLALTLIKPYLLQRLIQFVSSQKGANGQPPEPMQNGYFYVVLIFLLSLVIPIAQQQAMHKAVQASMRMKITLVHAIYEKALRLSNTAKDKQGASNVANHFSVDTEDLTMFLQTANSIWTTPVTIAFALYFLYGLLGAAAFCALGIMFVFMPVLQTSMAFAVKYEKIKKENMDKRIKLVTDSINAMKMVKLYVTESFFYKRIVEYRTNEQRALQKFWGFLSVIIGIMNCAPVLITVTSFAVFAATAKNGQTLTSDRLFPALGYLGIIQEPLGNFFMIFAGISHSLVAYRRIAKFMDSEEVDPTAVDRTFSGASQSDVALSVTDGCFAWKTAEEAKPEEEPKKAKKEPKKAKKEATSPASKVDAETAAVELKEIVPDFELRDINMSVQAGALVAIVGRVGQGKTALLHAILGEMVKLSGSVSLNGSVAYASQQPWIFNGSVRENILFGATYDEKKYNTVLEACSLVTDLQILPNGDQTLIGDKGVNLSGGQKARVALARAVYSDANVFLLDDCLSAVDAHVDKHIFNKVIGRQGLLAGKTIVLVTHGVHHLSQCDRIIAVKDGRIAEQGTYSELMALEGVVQGLVQEFLSAGSASDGAQSADATQAVAAAGAAGDRSSGAVAEQLSMGDDDTKTGTVTRDVYKFYVNSVGTGGAVAFLVSAVLFSGSITADNLWSAHMSNVMDEAEKQHTKASTGMLLGVYSGIALLQMVTVTMTMVVTMIWLAVKSSRIIHARVLATIFRAPMSWFDVTPVGRIMNRFSSDISALDQSIPIQLANIVVNGSVLLTLFVQVGIAMPPVLAVVPFLVVGLGFIGKFYLAGSRELQRLTSNTTSPMYQLFTESVDGLITIRAFGYSEQYMRMMVTKVDRNVQAKYISQTSGRWLTLALSFASSVVVLGAALCSVIMSSTARASDVGLALLSAQNLVNSLRALIGQLTVFETAMVSVERLKQYTDLPAEAAEHAGNVAESWPASGDITFDNYSATYKEGLEPVLKNLNLTIRDGEKIGICGRTGAGKSTITLSLFRIIEALQGSIIIDGQDISKIGLTDLRSRLTIIPQDPVMFQGTLRENMDPLNQHTDAELWRALENAGFAEYAQGLEGKLEAKIESGGSNLSAGQRQLLTMATALLRKRRVVIMDEATSATDPETDALVQRAIRSEFKECTVLTIAHRIATIMDSDRILVLDKGQVAEFDSPANLLQNPESHFSKLVRDTSAQRQQAQ